MLDLSRSQLLVYGAIAVAVLLLGARWIRSAEADGGDPGAVAYRGPTGGSEGGTSGDLVVHVAGEVRDPGVYRLPQGSRVTDAIERAGGPTAEAVVDSVNLAAEVADGQQVVVPAAASSAAGVAGTGTEGPISIGTATVEQLDTIEGIGPVTAQAIIDFRDEQGGIASIDQLDQISGIGPATMEALRAALQP